MSDDAQATAAGFIPLPLSGTEGFHDICGPLWIKAEAGRLIGGFRVERRHCNPAGICHGGMLATFADTHMGIAAQFENRFASLILPTVTLSVDYLAPTPNGAWVEARADILKVTRGTVFAAETITADGIAVAHARGIFKIPPGHDATPLRDFGSALRRLLLGGEEQGAALHPLKAKP